MTIEQAEGEFHLYALEWTEDAITTYVDGKGTVGCYQSNNWELVIIVAFPLCFLSHSESGLGR